MSWKSPQERAKWRRNNKAKVAAADRAYYLANKEKFRDNSQRWRKADPKRWAAVQRRHKLKKFYHLTEEQFNSILASQGGHCKFCDATENLCVDHDHKCCNGEKSCGKCVRFILCPSHNVLLGRMEHPKHAALIKWFREVNV